MRSTYLANFTRRKCDYVFINKKTGEAVHDHCEGLGDGYVRRPGYRSCGCTTCAIRIASFLVNSGRTLYEVQHILGHSDTKVTERYAHLSTKTLQDAANSASRDHQGVPRRWRGRRSRWSAPGRAQVARLGALECGDGPGHQRGRRVALSRSWAICGQFRRSDAGAGTDGHGERRRGAARSPFREARLGAGEPLRVSVWLPPSPARRGVLRPVSCV